MDPGFVNRLSRHRLNRTAFQSRWLCHIRRFAFRLSHAWRCGAVENCNPRYTWCYQTKLLWEHFETCEEQCRQNCQIIKQLSAHFAICRTFNCDICPYRVHNIDDIRSEEEEDPANGERFVREEPDSDLESMSSSDPDEAEDDN